MLPSFFNQTITRLRAGQKESRGSIIPDWSNPDSLVINNCSVQPAESNISIDGRVLGLKNIYRVYSYMDIDVQAGDRIIFEDETFTVDEAPRKWRSPTGSLSNIQFSMTHWAG